LKFRVSQLWRPLMLQSSKQAAHTWGQPSCSRLTLTPVAGRLLYDTCESARRSTILDYQSILPPPSPLNGSLPPQPPNLFAPSHLFPPTYYMRVPSCRLFVRASMKCETSYPPRTEPSQKPLLHIKEDRQCKCLERNRNRDGDMFFLWLSRLTTL
jgi:hypothetical protein